MGRDSGHRRLIKIPGLVEREQLDHRGQIEYEKTKTVIALLVLSFMGARAGTLSIEIPTNDEARIKETSLRRSPLAIGPSNPI